MVNINLLKLCIVWLEHSDYRLIRYNKIVGLPESTLIKHIKYNKSWGPVIKNNKSIKLIQMSFLGDCWHSGLTKMSQYVRLNPMCWRCGSILLLEYILHFGSSRHAHNSPERKLFIPRWAKESLFVASPHQSILLYCE